jgi:hypothetical protein
MTQQLTIPSRQSPYVAFVNAERRSADQCETINAMVAGQRRAAAA